MHDKTLAQQAAMLRNADISSAELTDHYLERIERLNTRFNAYLHVDKEGAKASAVSADRLLSSGKAGPLTGIPIAHKDIFCTKGITTTCGSRILENFKAPYNATVVDKLSDAGVVMLGKVNMDEFAMGSSNENSYFGPVANPWDRQRVPGGSSGGSAVAVAAQLASAATGTDTGGSIRQPAAFCGITGIKPTYGRISRYGMIAFASSLDQAGPMARTAEDCALLLQAMCGHDEKDSTSSTMAVPDFSADLNKGLDGLRIGVPQEYFREGLDPAIATAVHSALAELEKAGAILKDVSLPNQQHCIPAYYVIAPAEASSNLSRFDGVRFGYRCENPQDLEDLYTRSRGEGFGNEVKRRILIGTYALSEGYYDAYYLQAQKVRQLVSNDFIKVFKDVDVIAGPTTPTTAFASGAKSSDPISMYLNDLFTVSANLSGLPGISAPCGFSDGLPIGLQLVAPANEEARLLNITHRFQQMTDWHTQSPADIA